MSKQFYGKHGAGSNKMREREIWMESYETQLVLHYPAMRGAVDWNTATHFYNSGLRASEAVRKFVENHPKE